MLKGPAKLLTLHIEELSEKDRMEVFEWIGKNYKWLYEYAQMGDGEKRFHRERRDKKGLYFENEEKK